MELSPADEQELRALLAAGRMIEAIKRHRQLAGCGLAESKAYIDGLLAEQPRVHAAEPGTGSPEPRTQPPAVLLQLSPAQREEILAQLALGEVLRAGMLYAAATGERLRMFGSFIDDLGLQPGLAGLPPELLSGAATHYYYSSCDAQRSSRTLAELSRAFSEEQRARAFARIAELFDRAYDICDAQRTAGAAEARDVIPRLRQQCPGFPENAYALAYERGMIDSR